ncbi:DMT family transporter [Asticcacaulis sp. BYS171W]|uniref:DMT family transporter n=1 Tax=Asticcacaulis aquaticus TaxID=2984212 RepID=A0ABT5HSN3_9CAUL|nr:DMT family transporter [Asticcacaulis aquaticus]MDC7682850.1 DMT family transporter [Asticcacaulis aquaticus]
MTDQKKLWLGIGCGVAAGALWGLVFLTPELVPGFSALQLSAGRYLAYGLVAAVLILPSWPRLRPLIKGAEWRGLIWLSLTGNIIYYVLLAQAVQSGGVAMTTLIIGLLPVTVTLMGHRDSHVPLIKLVPSLVLGVAGIACTAWDTLGKDHGSLSGLLCAFGALIAWTVYAVGNSRWLNRLTDVTAHDWSLLTGVVTGALALMLAVPAFLFGAGAHSEGDWWRFLGVVTGVAILCSVIGNAFWNRASRLLPMSLIGQMILFETLFALLYGFLWEARLPTVMEGAAIGLLIASVLSCAHAHRAE